MYKKDLVKTVALASIIAIATTACGKEEVVSTLDTAQKVVASVEEKTVEKAIEDSIIASTNTTSDVVVDMEEESVVSDKATDVKIPSERKLVSAEQRDSMSEAEMNSYFDTTSPEEWDIDLYGTHFLKYGSDYFNQRWEDDQKYMISLTDKEEQYLYDEYLTPYYTANPPDMVIDFNEVADAIAKEYGMDQEQEYTGPRPTGGSQNVIYDPTPVDTTITTNTRGNIS